MLDLKVILADLPPDRYQVEREIGAGRLAKVFLAHDLRHLRKVAVKALHPEHAEGETARRFHLEIEIAASLIHPNIVPVFDSDEIRGIPYFVMPYEEGGTLRDRLDREGQLPLRDAVRLAYGVLEALRCAHRHGVVHFDVKPENILLSQGHALLADFGIARVRPRESGEGMDPLDKGVGTPAYMSPEQAEGDSRQDPRSDLYSVGCVLFEMLTGDPPFKGPSPLAVLNKQLCEPAPPLSFARPSAPEQIEAIIETALQKRPADRYPDAESFLEKLRSVPMDPARPRPQNSSPGGGGGIQAKRRVEIGRIGHPGNTTVWIVEDHRDYREDVVGVIEAEPDLSCPVALGSLEELLKRLSDSWAPDVVLMDIHLGRDDEPDGIQATSLLNERWPETKVIMLTGDDTQEKIADAFDAGAISYLAKTATDQEILKAIRAAPMGGSVMTIEVARKFLAMFNQVRNVRSGYDLSPQDHALLSDLLGGKAQEDMATERSLGLGELRNELRLLQAKLNVNHTIRFPEANRDS